MRPWRSRLALRRSRVQWTLLAVVVLVATLAATLLATLHLLSVATENFSSRAALTESDASELRVVHRADPQGSLDALLTASSGVADELFEDIPYTTSVQVEGTTIAIPREGSPLTLGYLGRIDGVEEHARLSVGDWPNAPGEAAVPAQLLEDSGIAVGDRLAVSSVFDTTTAVDVTVVGAYEALRARSDFWRFDRFQGEGYNPETPVPFAGGAIVVDGFGPLLTDAETIERLQVATVAVTYIPDFTDVSLADVQALLQRIETIDRDTVAGIGATGSNVRILTSLDDTVGSVVGSLAVTRSNVLVTGLMLLVLAIAALAQTARLIGERRHEEQSLMVARGASGRQLLALSLIEAVVVAAAVAAVAPVLARQAYLLLSSHDAMASAGMNQDPGIPVVTWGVSGVVGVVLIGVLAAPYLRRRASFIEAEQSRSRPGKRAAFQRSGVDIALVALAALAYWQLRSYESPMLADGGVARVDPLLAAGPALALLAGSMVAVRLIPAASRLLELIAARGRRAVMPLAAWEVGRRSSRAVSAILLLTLAVSIGTFAFAYLTTWRLSQDHQAQYRHPAQIVVDGLPGPGIGHRAWIEERADGAAVSPVVDTEAVLSTRPDAGLTGGGLTGPEVALLATDEAGLEVFSRGRVGRAGAVIPESLSVSPGTSSPVIELPGTPDVISLDLTPSKSETVLTDVLVSVRVVLRDSAGMITTTELGIVEVNGETTTMSAPVIDRTFADGVAWPLSVIGVQSTWLSWSEDEIPLPELNAEGFLRLTLSIDNIQAVTTVEPATEESEAVTEATPAEGSAVPWFSSVDAAQVDSLQPDGDQIHAQIRVSPSALRFAPAMLVTSAIPVATEMPVAVTRSAMARLDASVGDPLRIQVNDAVLTGTIVSTPSLLAGPDPRREAIVVPVDALSVGLMHAGASPLDVRTWWVDGGEQVAGSLARDVPEDATVTTQVGLQTSFKEDPLRVATQASLWLVTGAAIVLAALGFAVHAVVTVRARHLEFAQLRAVGVQRGQLLRVVSGESLLLAVVGTVFGVGIGVALGYLVAPLVSVGADGRPPLPSVMVEIPWTTVGLLAAEVAAVLLLAMLIVGILLRRISPAATLRAGEAG